MSENSSNDQVDVKLRTIAISRLDNFSSSFSSDEEYLSSSETKQPFSASLTVSQSAETFYETMEASHVPLPSDTNMENVSVMQSKEVERNILPCPIGYERKSKKYSNPSYKKTHLNDAPPGLGDEKLGNASSTPSLPKFYTKSSVHRDKTFPANWRQSRDYQGENNFARKYSEKTFSRVAGDREINVPKSVLQTSAGHLDDIYLENTLKCLGLEYSNDANIWNEESTDVVTNALLSEQFKSKTPLNDSFIIGHMKNTGIFTDDKPCTESGKQILQERELLKSFTNLSPNQRLSMMEVFCSSLRKEDKISLYNYLMLSITNDMSNAMNYKPLISPCEYGDLGNEDPISEIRTNTNPSKPNTEEQSAYSYEMARADILAEHGIPIWLKWHRLHKYTPFLQEFSVEQLLGLTDIELEAVGVHALGARRKLLKLINAIKLAGDD